MLRKDQELTRRCKGWYGVHPEHRILYDAGPGSDITDTICEDCLKRLDQEARKLISEGEDNG